jgi:hypothetical protein
VEEVKGLFRNFALNRTAGTVREDTSSEGQRAMTSILRKARTAHRIFGEESF